MELTWDIFLKLLLSVIIGGIIGAEREYRNKSAGFRTMMLISLGATLFTLFSIDIGAGYSPGRIASNIVTGVGFIGAGVIFRGGTGINGITTAATIWVTASLGMGVGAGFEWISLTGTFLLLPILFAFTEIENRIDRINHSQQYTIGGKNKKEFIQYYEKIFQQYKLRYRRGLLQVHDDEITGTWQLQGSEKNHQDFIAYMLENTKVTKFEF